MTVKELKELIANLPDTALLSAPDHEYTDVDVLPKEVAS